MSQAYVMQRLSLSLDMLSQDHVHFEASVTAFLSHDIETCYTIVQISLSWVRCSYSPGPGNIFIGKGECITCKILSNQLTVIMIIISTALHYPL